MAECAKHSPSCLRRHASLQDRELRKEEFVMASFLSVRLTLDDLYVDRLIEPFKLYLYYVC